MIISVEVPTKVDAHLIKVIAKHLRNSARSKKAWKTGKLAAKRKPTR